MLPSLFSRDPEPLVSISSLFPFTIRHPRSISAVELLCQPRDAILSMKMSRGRSSDLSAPPAPKTKVANRASFLQQDRRRRRAALRISISISISIDITKQRSPHCLAKIAASQQPRRQRSPRSLDLGLDLRSSSLLAVEAPLKRRRKQVLLLPTNPPHPP